MEKVNCIIFHHHPQGARDKVVAHKSRTWLDGVTGETVESRPISWLFFMTKIDSLGNETKNFRGDKPLHLLHDNFIISANAH